MRIKVSSKLWRLGSQFPGNYMAQVKDKSVEKLKHEKLQTPKSLLLFTEMDASLVGAPDFKPECTALTLS